MTPDEIFNILKECADFELKQTEHGVHTHGMINKPPFSGKRIKRDLYKSGKGRLINANVNGSYNIMRKEVGDVALPADRGFVFNPIKISF